MNDGRKLPGGLMLLIYSLIVMAVGYFVYKLIWVWLFHSYLAMIVFFIPLTVLLSKAAIGLFNLIFDIKTF